MLNRTELRHRMLAEVADDDRPIRELRSWDIKKPNRYERNGRNTLTGAERRALASLYLARLIVAGVPTGPSMYHPMPVRPTGNGDALLAEWNAKYGEEV